MSVVGINAVRAKAEERRELILIALRDTRCAMTADQLRDWIKEHKRTSITEAEIARQLRILETEGRVAHPAPLNTTQFRLVKA